MASFGELICNLLPSPVGRRPIVLSLPSKVDIALKHIYNENIVINNFGIPWLDVSIDTRTSQCRYYQCSVVAFSDAN